VVLVVCRLRLQRAADYMTASITLVTTVKCRAAASIDWDREVGLPVAEVLSLDVDL
jgi:hypothetical protein